MRGRSVHLSLRKLAAVDKVAEEEAQLGEMIRLFLKPESEPLLVLRASGPSVEDSEASQCLAGMNSAVVSFGGNSCSDFHKQSGARLIT